MLYIVVALKAEAQAFVDKFKLSKSSLGGYTFYENAQMRLIISGMGVESAMRATQTLINYFDITDDDVYTNIGICGGDEKYPIGSLLDIASIGYKERIYPLKEEGELITCVDEAMSDNKFALADMESFGFYEAVRHSPAIKNIYIFKVVSDHFQPQSVNKEMAKSLIFNQIDGIKSIIYSKGEI